MRSVVDICNKALSLIGQKTIVSLEDDSPEAYACRTLWAPLRDEILRTHPWNCASKRAVLPRLASTPAFGHAYEYQLPADCLMVLRMESDEYFLVEGGKLLTDAPEVAIKYIRVLDDSTRFDSQLAAALSFMLASELAYQMTSSASLAGQLEKVAKDKLADAKASDALEGNRPDTKVKRWLRAKYG
jgi:hypothetical protein